MLMKRTILSTLLLALAVLMPLCIKAETHTWKDIFDQMVKPRLGDRLVCPLDRYGLWQNGKMANTFFPCKENGNENEGIIIAKDSDKDTWSITWSTATSNWTRPCTLDGLNLTYSTPEGQQNTFRIIDARRDGKLFAVLCVDSFNTYRLYACQSAIDIITQ